MDGETAQSWENEQRNEGQIGNEKQAKGKQTERIETEEARGRWWVNGGRNRQDMDRTDRCTGSGIRKLVAQAFKIGLEGAERAPYTSAVTPAYAHGLPAWIFLQSQILMAGAQHTGGPQDGMGRYKAS